MLLENGQAIYCSKEHNLISKIMENYVVYSKRIRMMTRSNKVTRKMTIIGKFTMPQILWRYIDCVSSIQLWTMDKSYTVWKIVFSPSKCGVTVTVRWGSLSCAAFKKGHRKLMSVRNCAIPHKLYNFWFLTSASPTYSWTYHIPLECIIYHRANDVHSRNKDSIASQRYETPRDKLWRHNR